MGQTLQIEKENLLFCGITEWPSQWEYTSSGGQSQTENPSDAAQNYKLGVVGLCHLLLLSRLVIESLLIHDDEPEDIKARACTMVRSGTLFPEPATQQRRQ